MQKKVIITLAIILLVVSGYFLFFNKEKLNVGVYEGEFSSLILIAEENGYFWKQGLDVDITYYDNGVDPLKNVINNNHDISTCGEFVAVNHLFENENLRILSRIQKGDAIELIIKDSTFALLDNLEGKKIGLKKKSQAEYFLGLIESSKDIDIDLIDLNPNQMQSALDNNSIYGVMVWDPFAYNIKQELFEQGELYWQGGQSGKDFHFLLMTNQEAISEKSEGLSKFIKALILAEEQIKKDEDISFKTIQKALDYEDSYYLESTWDKSIFEVSLDQEIIKAMNEEGQWLIDNELTTAKQVPDYQKYIYKEILEDIDPSKVKIK